VKRQWHSLTELKQHLEKTGLETVKQFTGWQLITDQYEYTLVLGQLRQSPRVKNKKKIGQEHD
jgi:hypothetical protein